MFLAAASRQFWKISQKIANRDDLGFTTQSVLLFLCRKKQCNKFMYSRKKVQNNISQTNPSKNIHANMLKNGQDHPPERRNIYIKFSIFGGPEKGLFETQNPDLLG